MSTETASGPSDHIRGVTVTTVACLAGILAGVGSAYFVGTDPEAAVDTTAVFLLAAAVIVQLPLYKVVGIDVEEFGIKDNLYVTFMTFSLWFITYAVLLTSAVTL